MSPRHPPPESLLSDAPTWDFHAQHYDDAVGKSSHHGISRLISLVETVNPPLSSPDARVLDLGAGTGSLAFQLTEKYPTLPILATDISAGMLEQIRASSLWTSNITTQVVDMRAPVGGSVSEGEFSHVFSTMAIQSLPGGEDVVARWSRLLRPDGVLAIAVWDMEMPNGSGVHAVWAEAAIAVDPSYVNPPILPPGHWLGLRALEAGLEAAGFEVEKAESLYVGFDLGTEGFMRFFWEMGNPMPLQRQASFKGDLERVKVEMERLLDEVYDGGRNIPLWVGVVVARARKSDTV